MRIFPTSRSALRSWCGVAFGAAIAVFASTSVADDDGTVCSHNAYALCSHALCSCLDSSGELGASVIPATPSNQLYAANYGTTSCKERTGPTQKGLFPPFIAKDKIPDRYSQYSLGDSLEGDLYGTESRAQLLTCTHKRLLPRVQESGQNLRR